MRIKDLKKYFKIETGQVYETSKKINSLWEPTRNKTELRMDLVCGGFMSMSIPVVKTADTEEELL